MTDRRRGSNIRSLATIRHGETVQVECILFDAVRDICSETGIRPGDWVHCVAATASRVVLETTAGRQVPFERRLAHFIQVAPAVTAANTESRPIVTPLRAARPLSSIEPRPPATESLSA